MLRLRAHHLNCIPRFRGAGYNGEFCRNIQGIKSRLESGEEYEIVFDADDVCAVCPNLVNGVCTANEKAEKYDILTQKYGTADISKICSDCEWYYICKKIN